MCLRRTAFSAPITDANSVGDLQLCSKLYKLGAEFLVVGADNGEYSSWSTGECTKQPIEAFLPKNSTSGCSDIVSTSEAISPFWDNGSSIALGMTANLGSRQFDEMDPRRFGEPAAPRDQILNQHPSGR
jgi:hypothetical protein